MIRLNLVKDLSHGNVNHLKVLGVKFLIASFLIQGVYYWDHASTQAKRKEAITLLKKQVATMEDRKKEFLEMTPPEQISGAVLTRNEWFKEREKMPIFILSRLEKEKPDGVELKIFEAAGGGGNVQLLAPDMDSATRYLNGVLGTKNVRVSMVDSVPGGILAACTWTE